MRSPVRPAPVRSCRLRVALVTGLVGVWSVSPGHAQVDPPPLPGSGAITVTPGSGYQASGVHRGLFGGGYRDLWTTPIRVPVVDLSDMGGGLTPMRLGGGTTTRTLHLRGADGRRFVFRSVEKAPVEFEVFNQSVLAGLVQDQVSSFHPTGAPVVARLLDAVGVLHTEPAYMVVPDDPRLEAFREDFAGRLVLVEERPDNGPRGTPGFAGSRQIASTEELFRALEEDPYHRVDVRELLRARLVDILVGDRDRSHNNHLWAAFDDGEGTVWRVIPRDRDQAFVRFDGLIKSMARAWEGRLVSFEERYPDVFALTRNAWDIDRRLLASLDRESWLSTVSEVQAALTDEVIADAVHRMPPEHVALVGPTLTAALVARRQHLPEAAERLYDVVFRFPDIHGTDAAERLVVTRSPDGAVDVDLGPSGSAQAYTRRFLERETSEIRIYLRGGADTTLLRGSGARRIT
ncbi:MAG: hypothetical protein R3253_02505, partial [Longimicrobiales bacterium]|nr:hypothetical protein [Longimicrobiales bacterium]